MQNNKQEASEAVKAPRMAMFQFHVCADCGGELYNINTLRCNRCGGGVVPTPGSPKE